MADPGPGPSWTGERVHRWRGDRVAVIGDVHGRSDLLRRLLAGLDRPILVAGDLRDRGPDTRGCLDLLITRGATGVLGNHDVWLGAWAAGHGFASYALSPRMGGAATLASYGAGPEDWRLVPREHAAWINGLHLTVDLTVAGQAFWLVHAGVPSDRPLEGCAWDEVVPRLAREHPADLLWRMNDPEDMLPLDRPVIMGHRRQAEPLDTGAVLAIDTGCGMPGGRLTGLLLPERRFVTVG